MRGFGAIAIGVLSIVFEPLDSIVEGSLNEPDIFADAGKVSQFQRSSVFLNDVIQGNIVEEKFVLAYFKLFLWKFEGLFYQLPVALHVSR
jgi:hypothetical protein